MAILIFLWCDRAGLKLHLGTLRQFDRFQWSENAALINCMNRLHHAYLPFYRRQREFLLCAMTVRQM